MFEKKLFVADLVACLVALGILINLNVSRSIFGFSGENFFVLSTAKAVVLAASIGLAFISLPVAGFQIALLPFFPAGKAVIFFLLCAFFSVLLRSQLGSNNIQRALSPSLGGMQNELLVALSTIAVFLIGFFARFGDQVDPEFFWKATAFSGNIEGCFLGVEGGNFIVGGSPFPAYASIVRLLGLGPVESASLSSALLSACVFFATIVLSRRFFKKESIPFFFGVFVVLSINPGFLVFGAQTVQEQGLQSLAFVLFLIFLLDNSRPLSLSAIFLGIGIATKLLFIHLSVASIVSASLVFGPRRILKRLDWKMFVVFFLVGVFPFLAYNILWGFPSVDYALSASADRNFSWVSFSGLVGRVSDAFIFPIPSFWSSPGLSIIFAAAVVALSIVSFPKNRELIFIPILFFAIAPLTLISYTAPNPGNFYSLRPLGLILFCAFVSTAGALFFGKLGFSRLSFGKGALPWLILSCFFLVVAFLVPNQMGSFYSPLISEIKHACGGEGVACSEIYVTDCLKGSVLYYFAGPESSAKFVLVGGENGGTGVKYCNRTLMSIEEGIGWYFGTVETNKSVAENAYEKKCSEEGFAVKSLASWQNGKFLVPVPAQGN